MDQAGSGFWARSSCSIPSKQTFDDMLDGWRNQQLSRNLKFDTIDQRIRYVRRFVDHVNEFPWHWTAALVEEYFGDLRSIRHLSSHVDDTAASH